MAERKWLELRASCPRCGEIGRGSRTRPLLSLVRSMDQSWWSRCSNFFPTCCFFLLNNKSYPHIIRFINVINANSKDLKQESSSQKWYDKYTYTMILKESKPSTRNTVHDRSKSNSSNVQAGPQLIQWKINGFVPNRCAVLCKIMWGCLENYDIFKILKSIYHVGYPYIYTWCLIVCSQNNTCTGGVNFFSWPLMW